MTPLQAIAPLMQQVECGYRHVDPPIARQEHLQVMIRQLKRDRDEYRRLLDDTEKLILDYEVLAGQPF